MRNGLVAAIAFVLALVVGTHVFAFQEQKGGAAPAQAPDAAGEAPLDPGLNLSTEEGSTPDAESGTEIRIPGLGKVGVLPKMDFGLELLYGAAEQRQPEGAVEPTPTPDDLMIRGTVKHRF